MAKKVGNVNPKRVAEARKARALSQVALVQKVKAAGGTMSQGFLSRIENEARPMLSDTLLELAAALAVDPMWLLDETDTRDIQERENGSPFEQRVKALTSADRTLIEQLVRRLSQPKVTELEALEAALHSIRKEWAGQNGT